MKKYFNLLPCLIISGFLFSCGTPEFNRPGIEEKPNPEFDVVIPPLENLPKLEEINKDVVHPKAREIINNLREKIEGDKSSLTPFKTSSIFDENFNEYDENKTLIKDGHKNVKSETYFLLNENIHRTKKISKNKINDELLEDIEINASYKDNKLLVNRKSPFTHHCLKSDHTFGISNLDSTNIFSIGTTNINYLFSYEEFSLVAVGGIYAEPYEVEKMYYGGNSEYDYFKIVNASPDYEFPNTTELVIKNNLVISYKSIYENKNERGGFYREENFLIEKVNKHDAIERYNYTDIIETTMEEFQHYIQYFHIR